MSLLEEALEALRAMRDARAKAESQPDLSTPEVYVEADQKMHRVLARVDRVMKSVPANVMSIKR